MKFGVKHFFPKKFMNNIDYNQIKLIKKLIQDLNIDLSGMTVLTEVGSNNFLVTPIIPALAGAKKVIAWCNDTKHGSSSDIISKCKKHINDYKIPEVVFFRENERNIKDIKEADLITNSGMIRPLNHELINQMNSNSVISLMYESWELRESDVDIKSCLEKGIKLGGVNESHPLISVFDYVGILGIKFLLNAGIEIINSKGIIWSDDDFGIKITKAINNLGGETINTVSTKLLYDNIKVCDYIFLCDYDETKPFFNKKKSILNIEKITKLNPEIKIIHLYGDLDYEFLIKNNVMVYPNKHGLSSIMSETLSFVGPSPVIRLLCGGFKVGEELFKSKNSSLTQNII